MPQSFLHPDLLDRTTGQLGQRYGASSNRKTDVLFGSERERVQHVNVEPHGLGGMPRALQRVTPSPAVSRIL